MRASVAVNNGAYAYIAFYYIILTDLDIAFRVDV